MGYNTMFTLELSGLDGLTGKERASLIREKVDKGHTDIGAVYSGKASDVRWYDYLVDLDRISAKYPNVLFVLTGWGEEAGDYWKTWFRNGKHVSVDATFPEVDLTKLPLVDTVDRRRRELEEQERALKNQLNEVLRELDKLK